MSAGSRVAWNSSTKLAKKPIIIKAGSTKPTQDSKRSTQPSPFTPNIVKKTPQKPQQLTRALCNYSELEDGLEDNCFSVMEAGTDSGDEFRKILTTRNSNDRALRDSLKRLRHLILTEGLPDEKQQVKYRNNQCLLNFEISNNEFMEDL